MTAPEPTAVERTLAEVFRYTIQHWWWRLTHPSQWMASRRYERTAGKTPPPEWWEEARKQPPTSGYCQRHKRAEPLDSWCHNEGAPMSPERRKRLLEWRADDAIAVEELRTGKARRFDDVRDAIAWLDSDDDGGPVTHVHVRAYSDRWDAYYCSTCRVWLEPECACGPACEYRGRPSQQEDS